jgi:hypothetical protein
MGTKQERLEQSKVREKKSLYQFWTTAKTREELTYNIRSLTHTHTPLKRKEKKIYI